MSAGGDPRLAQAAEMTTRKHNLRIEGTPLETAWRRAIYPAQIVMLAALYFFTAKAALLLAVPPGYATGVWPPSGLALAAVLLWGSRVWPGVWLGAALTNLTVQGSPLIAILLGTGNTL